MSLHKFEKEPKYNKCTYIMVQFIFLAKINLKGSILVSNKVKIGQEQHILIVLLSGVMDER